MNIDYNIYRGIWYIDNESRFCNKSSSNLEYMYTSAPLNIRVHKFIPYRPKKSIIKFLCKNKTIYKCIARFLGYSEGSIGYYKIENEIISCSSELAQKCIVEMVNCGVCDLESAIIIWSQACERCRNVLVYKYLDEYQRDGLGYEEFTSEWLKSKSTCCFCKDMVEIEEVDLDTLKDKNATCLDNIEESSETVDIEIKESDNFIDLINNNEICGCGHCNTIFEHNEFDYIYETGKCPYCDRNITKGLVYNSINKENLDLSEDEKESDQNVTKIIYIEDSDHLHVLIVNKEIDGCGHCNKLFEDDDFAYANETGLCQYCHTQLKIGLIKNETEDNNK